jgi:hypothetical protein
MFVVWLTCSCHGRLSWASRYQSVVCDVMCTYLGSIPSAIDPLQFHCSMSSFIAVSSGREYVSVIIGFGNVGSLVQSILAEQVARDSAGRHGAGWVGTTGYGCDDFPEVAESLAWGWTRGCWVTFYSMVRSYLIRVGCFLSVARKGATLGGRQATGCVGFMVYEECREMVGGSRRNALFDCLLSLGA